jgi:hypothetical protein
MIRYNNTIELSIRNNVQLKTDRGQTWETSAIQGTNTPWTDWWSKQNPSDLRKNQKDYFLELVSRAFKNKHYSNEIVLYTVYQRGAGYNQPHDIALANIPKQTIWLLSTNEHTWIEESSFSNIKFSVDTALPSINTQETQDNIWELYETFRRAYA